MPAWTPYPQLKIIVLLIVMLATVSAGATYAIKKLSRTQPPHQFESLPTFKIQPELWPLIESEQLDIGTIEAKSVILINENSGQIVAQRQADTKLPIASTTKIMTAALALEFLDPQSTITIPDNIFEDLPPDSALMGISPGEVYTLEELLYGLMLNSGNDAANAIALAVSGSQSDFVNLMNAKAAQLGLTSTNFANPSGLDHPNHYSTARELAIIAHYARSFPIFKEIVKSPSRTIPYTGNHKYLELTNLNPLLTIYPGTTGIKPGNTGEAGNCLVASVNRDGVRYIGVLLDTPGRNTNMAALFDLAYATQP